MKQTSATDRAVLSYTITAGAVLAASATANAQLIYSGPKNLDVGVGFSVTDLSVDLDGNAVNDFRFWFNYPFWLNLDPQGTNAAHVVHYGQPARLAQGATIGPALSPWHRNSAMTLNTAWGGTGALGYFNNQRGYIGVKFYDSGAALHYGWIQFNGGLASGTIVDWAYESKPDTAIQAGAVPEPAQAGVALGLLALGAAGVRRMRQMTKA
jgi:hypothetical protein